MKRFERLALWLLIGYGFCACTRTSEVKVDRAAEVHKDLDVDEHAHGEQHESGTATTGAIDKSASSTTEDVGVIAQAADGSTIVARVQRGKPLTLPPGSRILGTLPIGPRRETGNSEHQAPSTAAFDASASEDKGLDLRSHEDARRVEKRVEKKETDIGPRWWVWVLGAAGAAVAGVTAWKLKPAWLSAAIGIAKRL